MGNPTWLQPTEWPYGKFHLESKFQQIRFWGFRGVGSVSMSLMRYIDHLAPFLQTLYSVSVPNRFSSTWRISKNHISHQNDSLCSYCKWEIPLTERPYGKFHLEPNFQQIRFWGSRGVGSVSMSLMRSIDHLARFLQTLYSNFFFSMTKKIFFEKVFRKFSENLKFS